MTGFTSLLDVPYRRLSHHEAVYRDCRDRAFGDRLRHPFRARRIGKSGGTDC